MTMKEQIKKYYNIVKPFAFLVMTFIGVNFDVIKRSANQVIE